MRKFSFALSLGVVLVGNAVAQLAAPAKEIQDLKWMVGTWVAKGEMTMMGSTMPFESEYTLSMDGAFLKGVNKQQMMGMDIVETSYMYFDKNKKEYVMQSFANFADTPRVERGTMKDGALVMVSDPWDVMGTQTVSRATVKNVGGNPSFKLEFKNGEKWEVASEVTYTKKK